MTTVYYVIEKAKDAAFARPAIGALLTAFGVAPLNEAVCGERLPLAGRISRTECAPPRRRR